MKKIIPKYILIFTLIFIIFKNGNIIKNNIYETYIYFIKNILPSLFPLMFISLYLKHNVLNKTNNKFILYTVFCSSFAPSNALLTDDKNIILFTWIVNPFYSYYTIKELLNKNCSLFITLTNIIINYVILFIYVNKKKNIEINNIKDKNINEITKDVITNIINIFGVTLVFSCIMEICKIYKLPIKIVALLDVINGFKIINNVSSFKLLLVVFLNSFTGLNIYFQIKSINKNINLYDLCKKLLLSILIAVLTILLISLY